ncbi:MAG: cytochrome P450 [Pseudomonadota bacterium]
MAFALNSPRFQTDRYGFIEELRAEGAFAKTTDGATVFFSQEDAKEVLKCADFRFAFPRIDKDRSPYLAKAIEHELLNQHGAAHLRLSQLVKMSLRDRVFEGMRDHITKIVADLLNALSNKTEIEFCSEFADPLPANVLGPMFDIPYDDIEGLNEWIRIGGRKIDALESGVDIDVVEDANRKMHTYLRDVIIERRAKPGDDLLSELIVAEIDGDRMTEDELVYLCAELASAGVDTTRAQLPLILNMLIAHPTEMAKLRHDPKLSLRAVDEGMWFTPLTWVIPHAAVRKHELSGASFEEGDIVLVMVPAVNRDPIVVEDPNTFNITRARARNFTFGGGAHSCPGAQIARMEMSIALEALARTYSTIEYAKPLEWQENCVDRTLKSLSIRVEK